MRQVRILCIGKTQDEYLKSGIQIYEKRIRRYSSLQLHYLKEANHKNLTPSQSNEEEGKQLLPLLSTKNVTVLCDEKGQQLSSLQLSKQIERWGIQGVSQIDFLIGGAYGFSDEVREKATLTLSFSKMTLTHQMFRLFLIEQIYRAFTIINGEKYHHL